MCLGAVWYGRLGFTEFDVAIAATNLQQAAFPDFERFLFLMHKKVAFFTTNLMFLHPVRLFFSVFRSGLIRFG